jgi:hypothetical protein
MKISKIWLVLVIALFLGTPAFADTFTAGEVFDITGFDNANPTGTFWTGSFTLGTLAGGSIWNVSAFAVDPLNCLTCTPSLPPWTLTSFQFDSATGDLSGTSQANFNGLGVGVHLLTLTFVDANNTSDPWSDLNKFGGLKTGTFSYCTGANCTNPNTPPVPEPSAYLLLASGLMSLVVGRRLKCSNR